MHDPRQSRQRSAMRVRKYALGAEPRASMLTDATAEECIEMVAVLTRRAWELSGRPWPTLPRREWPVRVIQRR